MAVIHANTFREVHTFSLSKTVNEGWALHGDAHALVLSKGNNKVKSDIEIITTKVALYCGYFKRTTYTALTQANTNPTKAHNPNLSIKLAHGILGHTDEAKTI